MATYSVGQSARIEALITKDGVAWDLTGATLSLEYRKPDDTTGSVSGSAPGPEVNRLRADIGSGVFTTADVGRWRWCLKIVDGTITGKTPSPAGEFWVVDNP